MRNGILLRRRECRSAVAVAVPVGDLLGGGRFGHVELAVASEGGEMIFGFPCLGWVGGLGLYFFGGVAFVGDDEAVVVGFGGHG